MIVAPDQITTLPKGLVMVAGCFDMLHAGHLAYFEKARAFGPLCCAVASDDYIRTTKHRPPLLPQATRMAILDQLCDFVIAQDESGDAGALEDVRPSHYAKGYDWLHTLPDVTVQACAQFGIPAVFLDGAVKDSSTARLAAYQRELDDMMLTRFESFIAAQQPAARPWTPVTPFDFESRKAIEGIHPQLIKNVFQPRHVMDAGCGPDGILVRLLRQQKIDALGFDVQADSEASAFIFRDDVRTAAFYDKSDLVVCRELLEHLTVRDIARAVRNLVALSSKYVYLTCRLHGTPTHLLDVQDHDDLDPDHRSLVNKTFLRLLFILEGCTREPELEAKMDWQGQGRVLVYRVPA